MKTDGLSRVSKELIIKQVEGELKKRPFFILTNHAGVSGIGLDKLRARLRGVNSRYLVVKNTLGRRAFEKANLQSLAEDLTGACGIAFAEEPVGPSRVVTEFAKENESFKIRRAMMNGKIIGAADIKALAGLPSREVLLARALGGMMAPISKFVVVLSGTIRKVVIVLDAISRKKQ